MHQDARGLVARIAAVVYGLAVVFLLALLVGQVLSARYNVIYYYSEIREVRDFSVRVNDADKGQVNAPATIGGLQPGDVVELTTTLDYRMLNSLTFPIKGAAAKTYADGRLISSYGDADTFPAFQKEPPPTIIQVTLPETFAASKAAGGTSLTEDKSDLRIEYTIPSIHDSLEVPVMLVGDKNLAFQELLSVNIISLILGMAIVLGGITLIIIGLVVFRHSALAASFIWLGLACLACSAWTLGGNDAFIYLIPQKSMLYTLSYAGLYVGIVPLLRFGQTLMQPRYRWPLAVLQVVMGSLFIVVAITHLAGVYSFTQWRPFMQVAEFAVLILFIAAVAAEMFLGKNSAARYLMAALAIFSVFAASELANQYTHFMPVVGELLQVGVLFLVAVLTYVAWQQVNATMEAAERSEQLSAEIVAVNRNLEMQRALYETLAKSTAEIRKLRHDMRHQLSAIKGMMADGRPEEAEDYIDTLYDAIPTLSNKIICDNHALNALASHYLAIATEAGIQCDLHMDVPKKVGRILDNDLCVIVGNLFENAIEACGHVEPDKRFIKLMTKVEGPRLILTLDNSYDGQLKVRNGEFYSRKRGMTTRGIGIQSVKSEVLKYDGAMKYEAEDEVFKTSLYVKL